MVGATLAVALAIIAQVLAIVPINARIYDIMYLLLQIMIVCSYEFDLGIVLCT